MSFTGYAQESITFVDDRFNQVLKEYSYRSGDAKVTPDTVINPYGNEYVNIIKGDCELLENEIGYMSADRVLDAAKYPFTAVITAFYPPLAWSEYDFRLDDKSTISIEYSGEGGVASYAAKDNRLAITVNKPGAFSIEVTGFDKNRDLTQNGPRYKYPEAE